VLGNLALFVAICHYRACRGVFALLVAYNVLAKNKSAGGNTQENTGAKP
jgi:PTS system ascorbate-specific IIC component